MSDVLDLKQAVLDLKADERMIAFTGLTASFPEKGLEFPGVLKVAACTRGDGGGYLTLTFVVDVGEDPSLSGRLAQRLGALTAEALEPYTGAELEMMVAAPLGSLASVGQWCLQEYSFYFHKLRGRERRLLEDLLLPAIRSLLGISFQTTEWMPETPPHAETAPEETGTHSGAFLAAAFRRWFDSR